LTVQLENDPYAERAHSTIVEAGPERAVVEQPGLRELDNHLGIRHASALYTCMYAAARALMLASVAELDGAGEARIEESTTAYPFVPVGLITNVATRTGDGWESAASELAAGRAARVGVAVDSTNEDGRTVSTLETTWAIEPAAAA
jgi:acyl-coenzyme A thioesterase PaaI-like protein